MSSLAEIEPLETVAEPPQTDSRPVDVPRAMVVDEDATSRLFLKVMLERRGFCVVTAESAEKAQQVLMKGAREEFDCVLTDYQLPGFNGGDFLRWLRKHDSSLASIVITAESEKALVADSLRGGACDFLDKPVAPAQLYPAAERAVTLTRQRRQLAQTQAAAEEVGRVQYMMLDAKSGSKVLPITLCFHPKSDASGDFLSSFQVGPHQHMMLLTDVSGHDLKAAFLSSYFQGLIRGMLDRGVSPDEVFTTVNAMLMSEWNTPGNEDSGLSLSLATCAVVMNRQYHTAIVMNSGCPVPLYINNEGRVRAMGSSGGTPLGWFENKAFLGCVYSFKDGGHVLLWSDGVEAYAEQERVSAMSVGTALLLAKQGLRALPDLSMLPDDILVACVGVGQGQGPDGFLPVMMEEYNGAQMGEIDRLQMHWQRSLQFCLPELSDEKLYDVLLASREAVLNALDHGCKGEAGLNAKFQISYHAARGLIRVLVQDPGPGHEFNLAEHERRASNELMDSHRGLILIHHLAGRCQWERSCSCLTMDFTLHDNKPINPTK